MSSSSTPSVLNADAIKYAKKNIKKMHPLYNLDLELCLPFLDPVLGVTRRCFGHKSALQTVEAEENAKLADADAMKLREKEQRI